MRDTPTGEKSLSFTIKFQICDEHTCLPPMKRQLSVPVQVAGTPVDLAPELERQLLEVPSRPKMFVVPAKLRDQMSETPDTDENKKTVPADTPSSQPTTSAK